MRNTTEYLIIKAARKSVDKPNEIVFAGAELSQPK